MWLIDSTLYSFNKAFRNWHPICLSTKIMQKYAVKNKQDLCRHLFQYRRSVPGWLQARVRCLRELNKSNVLDSIPQTVQMHFQSFTFLQNWDFHNLLLHSKISSWQFSLSPDHITSSQSLIGTSVNAVTFTVSALESLSLLDNTHIWDGISDGLVPSNMNSFLDVPLPYSWATIFPLNLPHWRTNRS